MIVNRLSAMLVKTAGRSAGAMRRDRRGNVAITFALMAVPLIAMVGLGVDYYRLLSDKARLDTAADAAALAAINTMMAYINANSQSLGQAALTSNAEAAGAKQALGRLDVHPQGALGVVVALGNEMDGGEVVNNFRLQPGQSPGDRRVVGEVHRVNGNMAQVLNPWRDTVPVVQNGHLLGL